MLKTKILPAADNAYQYPLLIKRLLMSGARYEKTREIVYRDQLRYSYATFNERVARLANVLSAAGVKAGDTVAVMDWDSHRYLECMFAIPMLGAVLHTINIRLSPDQILYTMNHAEDKFVLVNSEFVPLYKGIEGHLTTVEKTILLTDAAAKTAVAAINPPMITLLRTSVTSNPFLISLSALIPTNQPMAIDASPGSVPRVPSSARLRPRAVFK